MTSGTTIGAQHPFGRIVENWPRRWKLAGGLRAVVWPLPGPLTEFMTIQGWPPYFYDLQDPLVVWALWSEVCRYWKGIREGDIFVEGPFAGLPAH